MRQRGVTVLDNWRTMGMRGTGSNDVLLEDVFVPDDAIALRRPRGQWHPFYSLNVVVAMPIVLSVYLGIAEAARDLAVQQVQRKRDDPDVWYLLGEMKSALTTAQMAVHGMIDICANYEFTPDVQTANQTLIRKTIAAQSVLKTVEKALAAIGGGGFFTSVGLERLLRDVHGAEFHPLQEKRQHRFTGRIALGLDPVG
jgi:alkylation response protein AidB-like acyl-CoA dehydrogenase